MIPPTSRNPPAPQPGLLAIGDSITRGDGAAALGVHCQSWALWLAQALELPCLNLARDGATAADVIGEQLPRVRHGHAIATVYAGVNDVRSPDFDADAYATALDTIVERVAAHAQRVVLCTIPLDLGRPRAGAVKVGGANATIRAVAGRYDAVIADLSDLAGRLLVLPDAVHPTALGQLEIADRAASALGVAVRPSSLVQVRDTAPARVRHLMTDHAPALARDLGRRGLEELRRRRVG